MPTAFHFLCLRYHRHIYVCVCVKGNGMVYIRHKYSGDSHIKFCNLTLYAPCIVLQCIYIDQLDAQILVINFQTLFS